MSQKQRDTLAANPKLSFTDGTQAADLKSEGRTNTYLIALLEWLLKNCAEPIELLAVRTDHPTHDGPWAHTGGMAVDLYPKNWNGREQEAVCNVLKALAENPYCEAVGLGGVTQQWVSYVTWPKEHFVVFFDNTADHIHTGCANAVDAPGARKAHG
jgi:hypothetical protein